MRIKFLLLFLLLTACNHAQEEAAEESVIQIPEMTSDFMLPTKLWDFVTGTSFEKAVKQAKSFIFAPITVRLSENTKGLLAQPNLELEFAKGGGVIDFSKYVKLDKGFFKVFFDFEGFHSGEGLQIFYVSKTRERRVDNVVHGSGCKRFYNVKTYIEGVNSKKGIVLNVTRDRHDSAMGGHFVFSYKNNNQTYISNVTFTDSKRPDLFCEGFQL